MLYTISENDLKNIVKESIERLLDEKKTPLDEVISSVLSSNRPLLTEMAFKRKDYKDKIDNISAQIIENWCLIHYCHISDTDNPAINHWKNELRGHLLTAARYNIKGTDKWEDKEQAIREVWNDNDYHFPNTIEYVIYNKFHKENLNTDNEIFIKTISDCITSFNVLLHLISLGDIRELSDYVNNL